MTQPAAEQPRRIPLDELTSEALDQLYARLEHWEGAARKNGELYAAAENQRDEARTRAERAEAEVERMKLLVAASTEDGHAVRMAAQYADRAIENGKRADRYRSAWTSARQRAQAHQEGTLRHVADRDTWKAWTKQAEAAVRYWYDAAVERLERAKQAEAAIERVRAIADKWAEYGTTDLRDAAYTLRTEGLDEQQEQPPGPAPAHIGNRANAEDCPGCEGTNPPYPFICPGPPA